MTASSSLGGWHPHLDVWIALALIELAYLAALRFLSARHLEPGEKPATARQIAAFSAGVGTLWVAGDWPIHDVAEGYLYSVHMVQHLLITLIAPPLLLIGTPAWLARVILRPRPLMAVMRRLTRPVVALLAFNVILVVSHWPLVVELTVRHELAHFGAHAVLLASALLMWWPVLSPLAELPRVSYPAQMFYLFLQSIVPTVPASFLTFGSTPLYPIYETFPRLWGLSTLEDMRVAGLLMKIAGGAILWVWITALFFKWHAAEESGRPDVLEWQRVERELNRVGAERR